ncbi:MAG: tRNA (adenosine(37)-N6)-threonylcarbamoyltransferase complex ATPase subunit type 1 TsaE, partial [Phycisphaerae bacterium]|nr:tRNA (adenosine(37)-N6)-threonylcarbamoyltransferase complex ATPase subunit type 1 TsaE [Phycisphaerae bacterium]
AGDVLALFGALGAGKTQLVRGLAAGLGADARAVSSPTFVILCEYAASIPLVHVDAYRVNGPDDLASVGFDEAVEGENVVAVEWADRIAGSLPADRLEIHLEHLAEDARRIVFRLKGTWTDRCDELGKALAEIGCRSEPGNSSGRCPTCDQPVEAGSDFPFCSRRCRLVDLNKWFQGDYRLTRPIEEGDWAGPD